MTRKLLLAEDSLTIRKVFDLTFHQSDISLTMVDNGEDAVRLAGELSPDLVVTDVTLPDRNGFEVAAALRGTEATRSLPILILAGSLIPFDEETFRKCGADGVLFKPFESQELIDKVETLLRGSEVPADTSLEAAEADSREGWDFSDVLDEVEEEAGIPAATIPAAAPVSPGEGRPSDRGEEIRSLGDFDVSLEEIAREADASGPPPSAESPEPGGETAVPEPEVGEAPGGETEFPEEELSLLDLQGEDLGSAAEVESPVESAPVAEELPLASSVPPSAPEEPAHVPEEPAYVSEEPAPVPEEPPEPLPEHVLEPAPFVPPDPFVAQLTALEEAAVPESPPMREDFSVRAREIVEKVMWEMMERLSGEIRQQIREAVESVAWDVIPAAAESLIREEIERIRGKAGE